MLNNLRSKFRLLWHVFRGRATIYRVALEAPVNFLEPFNLLVMECTFTSLNPTPPLLPKCDFFKIERSICLRPVITRFQSLERGTLLLCAKHLRYQNERDHNLRHEHTSGCINTYPDCDYPPTGEGTFGHDEEVCYLGICHIQEDIDAVEEAEELPPRIEWVETAEAALAPPFGHVRHFTQEDFEQFHRYCGPDCVYPDE